MSKEKHYLRKRAWLNPTKSEDTGAVSCYVSSYEGDPYVDGDLSIWDCGRKVSLNFSIYSEKDAKDRAKKINTLISTLQEMKSALGKAYDDSSHHFGEDD